MENLNEIVKNLINSLDFVNIFWQISTPIIFIICDIIAGVLQALINHNMDSQKMREGLIHKALIIMILILSFVIQNTFNLSIIPKFVCTYIIVMEIISIFENLNKAGIDLFGSSKIIKEKSDLTTNENLNKLINTLDSKIEEVNSNDKKRN